MYQASLEEWCPESEQGKVEAKFMSSHRNAEGTMYDLPDLRRDEGCCARVGWSRAAI